MNVVQTSITPIRWLDERLDILDQRRLPLEEVYLHCTTVEEVAEAIRTLAVRGAPLIGITAAYGMVIASHTLNSRAELAVAHDVLSGTRPTAVNLFWALDRCRRVVDSLSDGLPMSHVEDMLLAEARAIHAEDAAACLAMGTAGAELFPENARVLTHCNAGALATGGIGTALGVIRVAHAAGKVAKVWVDETRPLLQGARLTAWELQHDGVPYQLICDNMAASLMASGEVDLVIVGADRISSTGDFANKIGTYGLAVLAKAHYIPFYVAAPWSTIDPSCVDGSQIIIEIRDDKEVCQAGGVRIAPAGAKAWNPSFDITPGTLPRGFITERGILQPPFIQ